MPTFGFEYRGQSFLELVQSKNHPALKAPNKIKHNLLPDEFAVAAKYGFIPDITMSIPASQNWFNLPRATRATMMAQVHIENVSAIITKLDQDDYWYQYSE